MSSSKKTAKEELKNVDKKSKVPMILGLALILGLVGFGAYYLLNNQTDVTNGDEETPTIAAGNPQSPTEAYKKLFEAVNKKDKEGIKAMMSKDSMNLAQMQAGQAKKEIDEVLKNGFFTANMASKMPSIRDERVKGKFGAVEVYSQKSNSWENIPFIVEDGAWKLAAGNMFAGSFKSPGKPRTIVEKENANLAGKRDLVPYGNGNVNMNVKPKVIDPLKDGKIPKKPPVKKTDNPTVKKDK